jgi:glycosyltransferase involved in cell wall biosynthesis
MSRRVTVMVKTNVGAAWLLPQVRELCQRGHDVLLVVADEDGSLSDQAQAAGAEVLRTPALGAAKPWAALRAVLPLVKSVREWKPDVVCSHLYRSALVGRFVAALLKVPHVHSVPGPLFLESRLIRTVERVLHRADRMIVATAQITSDIYGRLGVPPRRRVTVPYGADLVRRHPGGDNDRAAARAALGVPTDQFMFVCVAYFYATKKLVLGGEDIKGHDVLLDAWSRYKNEGGEGVLVLVGGGFNPGGAARRQRLLAEFGSTKGLIVLGSVTDVSDPYWAADVSIAPSRSENLGSAAEASAYGVPTLASRVGGLPELVVPGETGWLVEPGDVGGLVRALHRCTRLPAEDIQSMGRAARRRAETMIDLGDCVSRYVDVVEAAGVRKFESNL